MTFLAKPFVALGFGAFFLCAATCAHFDEVATTPLSLGPDVGPGKLRSLENKSIGRGLRWSCLIIPRPILGHRQRPVPGLARGFDWLAQDSGYFTLTQDHS